MKKSKKKDILILIFFIILIIVMIRAFIKSRANEVIELTASFSDNGGLLSEEIVTLQAFDEGESGYSITLPDVVNTKKVSKYIITKKEITSNNQEETQDEKIVEMIPGDKIYLTQEEFDNLKIDFTVEYDKLEVDTQILYNKKFVITDDDGNDIFAVSGYMPIEALVDVNEADISAIETDLMQKYSDCLLYGNFQPKIIGVEYQPKEYGQKLELEIFVENQTLEYNVIELYENVEQEGQSNVVISEINEVEIQSNKIKFEVEQLNTYLVLSKTQIETLAEDDENIDDESINTEDEISTLEIDLENSKFEIDDYESDKNYYLGLNYTQGMSKTNNGKYPESSLKQVIINYYGYNYSDTDTSSEDFLYGTISDTEQITLISYKKCVPVDSSENIKIELIDNPFLNRPDKKGFNGWKTNDTKYSNSIATNSNTFVQTLTTNLNNIKDSSGNYVINLYPDWVDANVIFVSSSGSSYNNGMTIDSPITNNWSTINSKLNSNVKTCSNASNREVNIVVLMKGTLDISGLTGPSTPYTLTSLYNGKNYGSSSTYLSVGSTNVQIDSDMQLHHLNIYTRISYSSPGSTTTSGTSAVSPCLYGNMYNLRIGRGIVPTNSSYCTWAQIQGGYYNHSSSEFRLVVESGQYYTMQLYRAYNDTNSTRATTSNGSIVIGSDVDRANNENEYLKIYNRMASKTCASNCSAYGTGGRAINMIIKSGTIGVDFFNNASTSDSSDRNYAGIYVGGHGYAESDLSDRYLLVEGGNIANVIGRTRYG